MKGTAPAQEEAFEPEEMILIRSTLSEELIKLAEFVDDTENWPGGTTISFKAKGRSGSIGKWPIACERYRQHVGRLLVRLAEMTAERNRLRDG